MGVQREKGDKGVIFKGGWGTLQEEMVINLPDLVIWYVRKIQKL